MRTIITILMIILLLNGKKIYDNNKVLFVGDSLTSYDGGWHIRVSKELHSEFDNISRVGKRLNWMYAELKCQLSANSNYSRVFIYGGCNDAYHDMSLDISYNYVQKMVSLCNQYKIEPVVILGYDPEKVMIATAFSAEITERMRNRYTDLQNKMKNGLSDCVVIPVNTTITIKDSFDGVHLNSEGNKKLAEWVLSRIKK